MKHTETKTVTGVQLDPTASHKVSEGKNNIAVPPYFDAVFGGFRLHKLSEGAFPTKRNQLLVDGYVSGRNVEFRQLSIKYCPYVTKRCQLVLFTSLRPCVFIVKSHKTKNALESFQSHRSSEDGSSGFGTPQLIQRFMGRVTDSSNN